jgi:hypothetical protein
MVSRTFGGEKSYEDFVISLTAIQHHGEETVRFSQFLQEILGGLFS